MERATKGSGAVTKADLRAIVNGQYAGDPRLLIDRLADELLKVVFDPLREHSATANRRLVASKPAKRALEIKLAELLIRDSSVECAAPPPSLPVTKLSPEEIISRTGMSKTTLYRADHVKFYSVVPMGMKNGRAYPAWQFVGNIPSLLPRVLEILGRKSRIQVNTFFVTERDALNELSPAEVLAGLAFEDRGTLTPAQVRMLALAENARLDKVVALATMEVADPG
ncbi:hypothetical protein C0Z18_01505 [Trinickia dabaoshanensis]|uniref:Uncharacterized protein n=1 Tax=Trinickia dabaoshanensis TaxID=564714 RepID=A0A2N7W382_9BURK|nr:hypothetical protein [Trinickia dabaoshanensis]PMS23869.1 hypothetical protein C0Z18_01505 [Trinickia dabaoshanensis]